MANRLPRSAALPTKRAMPSRMPQAIRCWGSAMVGTMASLGSQVFWLLMLAGCMLVAVQSLWGELVLLLGIEVFSVTVLCQLINLPTEFDASTRARHLLVHSAWSRRRKPRGCSGCYMRQR